jgi:hypothetical protein
MNFLFLLLLAADPKQAIHFAPSPLKRLRS